MAKSISVKKHPKVYAFIDSQNLNLGVKSLGWELDFIKFRIYLKEKYKVDKAFLFIGYIPKHQDLYRFLEKAGYVLVYKPVVESKTSKHKPKGNVDAELVLHTMIHYPHFSKAIIVSGDGDFYCLIEYLALNNKLAKIIVPTQKYSSLLREYRSYIVRAGDFKNKVTKKRGTNLRTKP